MLDCLEERAVPAAVVFYIDDTASAITLSGNVGGAPVQEQGPGSLTTLVYGTISTDLDVGAGTFLWTREGSDAYALDSGNWQPLANGQPGSAPANFGAQVNFLGLARAAVREAAVTAFTNAAMTLTDLGDGFYSYPASSQTLATTAGVAAYNHPILGGGSISIANQSGANQAPEGYLYDFGDGTYYLYAPVLFNITASLGGIVDATLTIEGLVYAYGFPAGAPGAPGGGGGSQIDPAAGLAYVTNQASQDTTFNVLTNVVSQPANSFVPVAQRQDQAPPVQERQTELAPPVQGITPHESAVDVLFTDLFRSGGSGAPRK